jgi:hypothetical protein
MPGFLFGAFGGVAGALLALIDEREPEGITNRLRCPGLWIALLIQATLSAMIVAAYQASGFKLNALLCVNVGAATPAILRGILSQVPPVTQGRVA